MSINIRFQKANKFFIENNYLKGLEILKNVWIQYPKNTKLIDVHYSSEQRIKLR